MSSPKYVERLIAAGERRVTDAGHGAGRATRAPPRQVDGVVTGTVDHAIATLRPACASLVRRDDADREKRGEIIFAESKTPRPLLAVHDQATQRQ